MEKELQESGLTKNESKIYLALLKIGPSTTGKITQESKLHRSRVYETLERLTKKGLVSHIVKSNKKTFVASEPSTILNFIEEKKKNILNILPALTKLKNTPTNYQEANIYEGIEGYKAARKKLIKELGSKDKLLIVGAPVKANKIFEGWLLDFHKKREKQGIGMKIIYDPDAKYYGKIRKKLKLTEVKYLKEKPSPSWFELFNESMIIGVISNNPICLVIKNKEIVESFKQHFKILWKNSSENP